MKRATWHWRMLALASVMGAGTLIRAAATLAAVPEEAAARTATAEPADVTAAKHPTPPVRRLPLLGVGLDAGVPDGFALSLVARPRRWARAQIALANNTISYGFRASACWLPFGEGPALAFDYGHYAEGNANGLARRIVGPGFQSSPLLDRVGYDFVNFHLGLNFGLRRVVFFVQGGYTMLWGQVHNLDQVVQQAAGTSGTTTVAVHRDPTVKASGVSAKVGLIAYAW